MFASQTKLQDGVLNIEVGQEKATIRNIDSLTILAIQIHIKLSGAADPNLERFSLEAYKHSPLHGLYKKLLQPLNKEQIEKVVLSILEQLLKPSTFYNFINCLFAMIQIFRIINIFCNDKFINQDNKNNFFDTIFDLALSENHILSYVDDVTKLDELVTKIIDKKLNLNYILKVFNTIINNDAIFKKIIIYHEDVLMAKNSLQRPIKYIDSLSINSSTFLQYTLELRNEFTKLHSLVGTVYYKQCDINTFINCLKNTNSSDFATFIDDVINPASSSITPMSSSVYSSIELRQSKSEQTGSFNARNIAQTLLPPPITDNRHKVKTTDELLAEFESSSFTKYST